METHGQQSDERHEYNLLQKKITYLLKYRLERWFLCHFWLTILIVDIKPDTHKLRVLVRAGEENYSHSYCILWWDLGAIWSLRLEHKFVSPCWHWTHKYGV